MHWQSEIGINDGTGLPNIRTLFELFCSADEIVTRLHLHDQLAYTCVLAEMHKKYSAKIYNFKRKEASASYLLYYSPKTNFA